METTERSVIAKLRPVTCYLQPLTPAKQPVPACQQRMGGTAGRVPPTPDVVPGEGTAGSTGALRHRCPGAPTSQAHELAQD